MPTDKEINAGVEAIQPTLKSLTDELPEYVGFIPARKMAHDKLSTAEAKVIIRGGVSRIAAAMEKARGGQ